MTNTAIALPFAGGIFTFHLTEGAMLMLELGTDDRGRSTRPIAIGQAYARLLRGRYELEGRSVGNPMEAEFFVTEMTAIIRAALVGGGGGTIDGKPMTWDKHSPAVDALMRDHVLTKPLMERWDLCLAIMGARVEGFTPPAVSEPA